MLQLLVRQVLVRTTAGRRAALLGQEGALLGEERARSVHGGNLSGNIEAAKCVGSSGGARWTCYRAYRESSEVVCAAPVNTDRRSFSLLHDVVFR